MNISQITEEALALPEADRLDLARRIISSITSAEKPVSTLEEGVSRLKDVFSGKVTPITEDEYRRSIQE
jgi:hypothetical protein